MLEPAMPAPLTRTLGRFVAEARFPAIPARALDAVRTGFTDCIAVMLAGRDEPVARIVLQSLGTRAAAGEASLCLGAEFAAAPEAALAHAVAGHALDYDDVALAGHPSVVLVPAILAEAEALDAGGEAAATAYAAGYEVWARLIERDKDAYHRKGWHPTAVLGPLAAAAACASLRRLDAAQATRALGMAASMAAGVVANFGTMTKPLQAGRAAASGVTAARLAEAGLSAAEDAIEHPVGLLAALSPHGRADTETPLDDLGRAWRLETLGVNVKKYPMCYGTHRAVDAMLDLVAANDLTPAQIAGVEVTVGRPQLAMLRNHRPATGLEAKFSMEFAMAAALTVRQAGLAQLSDGFVRRAEVQSLLPRISLTVNEEPSADDPAFASYDRVRVRLADGRELASPEMRFARGHWAMPLKEGELWTKFRDCTASALADGAAERLFAALQSVERLPSLRRLRALGPARVGA
jgi:2-methylcitrate dehydratase PrpD